MGNQISPNKISKKSSNANPVVNDNSKNKFSCMISYNDLVSAFRQYAISGRFLNYDKFNECISALLKFDIPLLPYTYLAQKLFTLMDKNSNGEIYEKDFLYDMTLVLSGLEARQRLSFEAMMTNKGKNFLEVNEIIDFFINSWLYGFRFIFFYINSKFKDELINSGVYFPQKVTQLENIVHQNNESIKSYVLASLKSIGLQDPYRGVDFEYFKKWIDIDHSLEICYYNKRFKFAMNLMCLSEIGLSLEGQSINRQIV